MRPPRRLKQTDIELLISTAIGSGLLEIDRDLLMLGIDPAVVLSLRTASNRLEQFQLDLTALNRTGSQNEEAALTTFLTNAARQLGYRSQPEGETFARYAILLCGPEATEEIHSRSFVLAGLVDGVGVKFVPIPLASPAKTRGLFFLSSGPVPICNDEGALSVETDKVSLIRWLASKRSKWPIRPPWPLEWKAALVAENGSRPVPPIALPRVADGRRFWCLEEGRLLARDYDGRAIDTGSADVWLIYELQR